MYNHYFQDQHSSVCMNKSLITLFIGGLVCFGCAKGVKSEGGIAAEEGLPGGSLPPIDDSQFNRDMSVTHETQDAEVDEADTGEIEAGEESGGEMQSPQKECSEQMTCLLACTQEDEACRHECVNEVEQVSLVKVQTAKTCIDQSDCSTDECLFSDCFFDLMRCQSNQNTDSCGDIESCLGDCGDDIGCALTCAYDADSMTRPLVDDWVSCLSEQSCQTLTCESCPIDELCQPEEDQGADECSTIYACATACSGSAPCIQACVTNGSANGVQNYQNLMGCDHSQGCRSGEVCLSRLCSNEMNGCGLPLQPLGEMSIHTCMELNSCFDTCEQGNQACMTNCERVARPHAMVTLYELFECMDNHHCQSSDCVTEYCYPELHRCVLNN